MNNLFKSIAVPLFCLLTGGALLPSARAFDSDKITASSVRIVSISSGNKIASGTGFLVNENGNIVTNQRLVDGAAQIFALQSVGRVTRLFRCKCEAAQQSRELNLAVLTSSIKASPVIMNPTEPKPASAVYAVGFSGISAPSDAAGSALVDAILKKANDPALGAEGVDMTSEMSANHLLQDMVSPTICAGFARRIVFQKLEAGIPPVKLIDCGLNAGHGYSGAALLDGRGFVIGVLPSIDIIDRIQMGIAESELEKFLAEHKINFRRMTNDKP
jgi:hypothetical protein